MTHTTDIQINPYDTYYNAGVKAGQAVKYRDFALYNHHREWFKRALLMASETERMDAGEAWSSGYKEGRGIE